MENVPGAKFCAGCGSPLAGAVQQVVPVAEPMQPAVAMQAVMPMQPVMPMQAAMPGMPMQPQMQMQVQPQAGQAQMMVPSRPPNGLYKGHFTGEGAGPEQAHFVLHDDGTITGNTRNGWVGGAIKDGTWDPVKLTGHYIEDHEYQSDVRGSFFEKTLPTGEKTWEWNASYTTNNGQMGQVIFEYDPTGTELNFDDEDCCFPADATVELESGLTRRMDKLAVGDVVRSDADGAFTTVYTFAHKKGDVSKATIFRRLMLESGHALELTPEHMVFVGHGDKKQAKSASNVRLGDLLTVVDRAGVQRVTDISTVTKVGGIFAPFTRSGSLVVNGVVASSYAHDYYSVTLDGVEIVSAQRVAEIALSPLAAFHWLTAPCGLCSAETCVEQYGVGTEGKHPYIAGLERIGDAWKWVKKGAHAHLS